MEKRAHESANRRRTARINRREGKICRIANKPADPLINDLVPLRCNSADYPSQQNPAFGSGPLDVVALTALRRRMHVPEDELAFLRDVVKTSRQKPYHVDWVDRDGTKRLTVLSNVEAVRLNGIAQRLKISKSEVLRQAAHVPVTK